MEDLLGLAALLVTVLAAVAGVFGFVWSAVRELEARLRFLETEFRILRPWAQHFDRKLQDDVRRMRRRP